MRHNQRPRCCEFPLARTIAIVLACLFAPGSGFAERVPADPDPLFTEVAKLELDPPRTNSFGHAIAVDGDQVLIGTTGENANDGYSAHIFERQPGSPGEWTLVANFPPESSHGFGYRLGLDRGTAVVSGDLPNSDRGGIWVFSDAGPQLGWKLVDHLVEMDPVGDSWGVGRPSVSGNIIVGGSPSDDTFCCNSGAAYVYERNPVDPGSWKVTKLMGSDVSGGYAFGNETAVDGETVVIGATGGRGVAYVFERNTLGEWVETARLIPSDPLVDDFARSIAIDGDRIAIASGFYYPVSAFVFERNAGGPGAWGEVAKLSPEPRQCFNFWVDLKGDRLVLGADCSLVDDVSTGAAYVFHREVDGTWREVAMLTASDAAEFMEFGTSVGLGERTVIVGADRARPGGAAYVFAESECVLDAAIVASKPLAAGQTIEVDVHLEHNRLATVTVPLSLWIMDAAGDVVAELEYGPRTFAYGDVMFERLSVQLPDDLGAGRFRLLVGIGEMNPEEVWAELPFQIDS